MFYSNLFAGTIVVILCLVFSIQHVLAATTPQIQRFNGVAVNAFWPPDTKVGQFSDISLFVDKTSAGTDIRLGYDTPGLLGANAFLTTTANVFQTNGLDSATLSPVTLNACVAEDEFGGALTQLGRFDEAYPHFVRAAQLQPADPVSHSNMGAYLHQHGHAAEAIPQYEIAARLTTDTRVLATTYANLGSAFADVGDYAKAHAAFDQSIRLNPIRFNTWVGMGLLAEREGKVEEAIRHFVRSVQLQPSDQGYFELGRTLAQSGRNQEAIAAYQLALQISPNLIEAQQAIESLRQQPTALNSR